MSLDRISIIIKYKCGGRIEFNEVVSFNLTADNLVIELAGGWKSNIDDYDDVLEIVIYKGRQRVVYELG